MGHANIDFVQSLYAAFGRGDTGRIVAAATPDVVWESVGRRADYPVLGVRHGPDGVQEFFELVSELQDVRDFSPREFFAAADRVFVSGHYAWTIRKTGRPVGTDWLHVFTIRNRKVAALREFTDTAQFAAAYRP